MGQARNETLALERVETLPTYQLVASSIEKRILEGVFTPGQQLPSELDLAKQLGVNRSTVREAIRVLEQNGLVFRKSARRLVISVPQEKDLAQQMTRAMILHEITFLELWEVMLPLEVRAAELAAERASAEEIALLEANLAATSRCLEHEAELVALDIAFHYIIAKASRNRALLLAREPIGQFFYPAFYRVMSRLNAKERMLAAHREIVNGIKNGDPRHAAVWMDKHIMDFRRGYELADFDINQPVDGGTARHSN
ncbi:FCD domain-containing protein [Xanthobacter sp. KR7-225]|uniref:FadR/GntR family transcriptional regulator n=1 Tax=Xanthobacter sp. KR7-225 TaxID=3156613 RepID=UPI0032B3759A